MLLAICLAWVHVCMTACMHAMHVQGCTGGCIPLCIFMYARMHAHRVTEIDLNG